jgi:hypothetical protein
MVDLEVFEIEIVNRRWNTHQDDEMTIDENVRFGRAEEGLARHQQVDGSSRRFLASHL